MYLPFIKLDHAELEEPLYMVSNTENITSSVIDANKEHLAYPFQLVLPNDTATEPVARVQIEFANVDLRLVQIARSVAEPPDFWYAVACSADWNTALAGSSKLEMTNMKWTQTKITAHLYPPDILHEMVPKLTYNPFTHPGLFAPPLRD